MKTYFFIFISSFTVIFTALPIEGQTQSYTFIVTDRQKMYEDGCYMIYGITRENVTGESDELEIQNGNISAKIFFENKSKVFTSWKQDSVKYIQDWSLITSYLDSMVLTRELMNKNPVGAYTYRELGDRFVAYAAIKNKLVKAWGRDMYELINGSIGIYYDKSLAPIKSFYISYAEVEYAVSPLSIILLSQVVDSQLYLYFLIDFTVLPEIFDTIFIPKKPQKNKFIKCSIKKPVAVYRRRVFFCFDFYILRLGRKRR